jgi:GntR family transcriptional regulator, transcriptional repressor for pyruvate dehydrogenase complex
MTVLQPREVIEPALAAEAAELGTDDDFREIADSIERKKGLGDDQAALIAKNRVFHSIVARAGGNKVLETFWDASRQPLTRDRGMPAVLDACPRWS